MDIKDVVNIDPERMSGAPCFTGTRVPIAHLFEYIENGETRVIAFPIRPTSNFDLPHAKQRRGRVTK